MEPKKALLLAGAALVAIGSGYMAMSMFRGHAAPKVMAAIIPQSTDAKILVATKELPVGTIIDPTSFRVQSWPKDMVDPSYYNKDNNNLAGTVVRTTIGAGQPLTKGSLVSPGERGFLAAALSPGMRAVAFPVGTQSSGAPGVAGFVFPGDRIDLVLTQTIASGAGQPLKTSETIVRNLRVLATDQHATVATDDKGNRSVAPFTNITVEATPRIAEKITVAQTLGTLSLSLRSIADNQADFERAIASGQVKLPTNGDPAAEKRIMMQFASHPIDDQVSFVTGGDVSHFDRKSVPLTDMNGKVIATPQLRSGGSAPRTATGIEPARASAAREVHIMRGNESSVDTLRDIASQQAQGLNNGGGAMSHATSPGGM